MACVVPASLTGPLRVTTVAPLRQRRAPHHAAKHGLGVGAPRVLRSAPSRAVSSSESSDAPVFNGRFGPFVIDEVDEKEVFRYRVGLSCAAVGFVATGASQVLPEGAAHVVQNPLCLLGAGGLGLALWEVHMYLGDIKRVMQALWLAGALGAVALAAGGGGDTVASFVAENPWGVWLVGPMFAALTGLAFKEGACYGKFEAIGLFFLVPAMCLTHLFSAPVGVQESLVAINCVLMAVFGARKWTQEIKDDVGDKSVFDFQKMTEEEQKKRIAEIGLTEDML